MIGRRLAVLAGVLGLALAMLVLPASAQAQAPPAINIFSVFPRCIDGGTEGNISGAVNRPNVRLQVLAPGGQVIDTNFSANSGGGYTNPWGFSPPAAGEYEFRVTAGSGNTVRTFVATTATASAFLQSPCRAPTLEFDPPCSAASTTQVRVTGRWFAQFSNGYVDVDADGSEEASRLPIDERGTFSVVLTIKPSSGSRPFAARDLNQNTARATWSPCPPGTVPTTSTSTTAPPVTDPDPVPETAPRPTTTTVRPRPGDPPPTTPPTLPPTIEVPPPTPGATLTLTPDVGPPGFVAGVTGTGFPPGPVTLVWAPGIGTTTTIAGPDGTLAVRMLIFPGDRLGPRALVATAGATTAVDAFLVVPSTVQPSGQNVAQINRIRRFNNR